MDQDKLRAIEAKLIDAIGMPTWAACKTDARTALYMLQTAMMREILPPVRNEPPPMPECKPARECGERQQPVLSDEQRRVINLLLQLALATDHATDDAEEGERDGVRFYAIDGQNFDQVSYALAALEDLPDDKPGYTLGASGKAEWALR